MDESVPGQNADISNVRTGLLPAFLSVSGKTRQNDLDIGFTISLQPGTSTAGALRTTDQENRQTFLTVGDSSWGSIKLGRDLGLFGADAILSDVTLLGTGSSFAGGNYRTGSNQGGARGATSSGTSLGRIGIGYLYADWVAQVSYTSPNWNGFSFAVAAVEPYQTTASGTDAFSGVQGDYSSPGFQGKVGYEFTGDVTGKVWSSFWTQEVDGINTQLNGVQDYRATIVDIGGKIAFSGIELLAYYYDGRGAGTTGFLVLSHDANGRKRDSDGGYLQAAYKLPGIGTKLAVSYGESNLDANAVDANTNLVSKNSSWVFGAYHPLTKSLNLVAEYVRTKSETDNGPARSVEEDNISLGAILFF
ncbi:porin [Pseudomethylobacillus aquaticus]|uniref:porin n=1 Tax=Pseudomethylobacillus aquaticus TaxID=2676064 RepID=UPI0011CD3A6D|nr:porin [Pseudomethylobacillus aquaticus]